MSPAGPRFAIAIPQILAEPRADPAALETFLARAEALGFDGLWASETRHDPFLPLALAAEHTRRVSLGTAIAVAFPRSPTVVAHAAWDLAALDADVVDDVASSEPNSLRLRPDSDMVVVFSGFKGGVWKVRTMVYIPSDHFGETWFILLNLYAHGGNKNWSTQVCFLYGRVESLGGSDFAGSGSLPWIADAWVPLELEIDLEANVQTIRYDGEFLDETVWQRTGINEIQAIDLYSNGGSYAYFDDISFTPIETGPRATRKVSVSMECPNPPPIQVTIQQPLAPGADPDEIVTVTETVRGALTAAQVAAANGGSVSDLYPERTITSQGFISSWLLLGPFEGHSGGDNPGCAEMERDFLTDGSIS